MTVVPVDYPPNAVILKSKRLCLNPIHLTDRARYKVTYGDALAMAHLRGPWTPAQWNKNAEDNHQRWKQQGCASWLVDQKNPDGSVDYNVSLLGFGPFKSDGKTIRFGCIVAPSHWRKGITREASHLALGWFFATFPDAIVITETIPQNEASQKTSEALGFRFRSSDDKSYVCEMDAGLFRTLDYSIAG
jgi:RimJ/RimL family protein N-acetyltransferase